MSLKGKKALVTGGAVRIGRAICEMLAEAGTDVCIHYNRSYDQATALRDQLEERGVEAHIAEANLMTETACMELMDKAVAMLGPLDILINNASVFNKEDLDDANMDVWMGEMWPNFFAPTMLMRAMAARGRKGKIVNLLDRRITSNDAECIPYLISKKALAEVTRLGALRYAPRIAVNGVAPGAVLPPPGKDEQYIKDHAGPVPLEIQVKPEDIARAVRFVLESDGVTGQVLYVDGGQHLLP